MSKLKAVDLTFSYFYFIFDLFSFYSIFRARVRVRVTRSHDMVIVKWLQVMRHIERCRRF